MIQPTFEVEIDGEKKGLHVADEAYEIVHSALDSGVSQIALVRPSRRKHPKWEHWLYKALGIKLIEYHSLLLVSLSKDVAHVSYEKNDVTFDAIAKDMVRGGGSCEFRTPNGEVWLLDRKYCIGRESAIDAINQFIKTGTKPNVLKWKRL